MQKNRENSVLDMSLTERLSQMISAESGTLMDFVGGTAASAATATADATPPSIISIRSLEVEYNGVAALKKVDLNIPAGKITALIGASGSGKSSLLRVLNRMTDTIPKTKVKGQVLFRQQDILGPQTDVIDLRRRIGMVFQNPTPFPKSIYDNTCYGLEVQGVKRRRRPSLAEFFSNRRHDHRAVEASCCPVDKAVCASLKQAALWEEVKERLHHSALCLSGGQQQRLCIARSIAVEPEVLLLDEPCSALDPGSTKKIEDLALRLKGVVTIIIVTHNLNQARRIADFVGFFHLGHLIEFGPASQIFESPNNELTRNYVVGAFG